MSLCVLLDTKVTDCCVDSSFCAHKAGRVATLALFSSGIRTGYAMSAFLLDTCCTMERLLSESRTVRNSKFYQSSTDTALDVVTEQLLACT